MKKLLTALLLSILASAPAWAQNNCRLFFQNGSGLQVEPQDTQMALFEPDCYAWRLFVSLNWPSRHGQCGPDPAKALGADGETVWEKWIPKQNVFLPGAQEPPSWESHCRAVVTVKALAPSAQLAAARAGMEDSTDPTIAFVRPRGDITDTADEEVRMNRHTLEFIRSRRLYSRDEQMRLAATGVKSIDFPLPAKEIKAHWIKLDEPADYARYHTGVDSDGTVYGLVAWHITTKDLPRWFWATFEHVDNESRWSSKFPAGFAGWSERPIDRFACEGKALDCAAIPAGIGLEGTKWDNYRLKATQIDWVDSFGEPTVAVNSKIENGFIQSQSSCISCHSLAMMGERSLPMPFRFVNDDIPADSMGRQANFIGVVGAGDRRPRPGVDPNWNFLQLDFVWSLRNAQPKK